MKSKLLASAAALALTACTIVATAGPASARGWHHGFGFGGAIAAGVIGGALAAATSPWGPGYYDYYPGYAYAPGPVYDYYPGPVAPVVGGGNVAWCEAHYRSYNPATGMYLGFDGAHHPCP